MNETLKNKNGNVHKGLTHWDKEMQNSFYENIICVFLQKLQTKYSIFRSFFPTLSVLLLKTFEMPFVHERTSSFQMFFRGKIE